MAGSYLRSRCKLIDSPESSFPGYYSFMADNNCIKKRHVLGAYSGYVSIFIWISNPILLLFKKILPPDAYEFVKTLIDSLKHIFL